MQVVAERLTDDNSLIEVMSLSDPEHFRTTELPRRIGFDKITVSLNIFQIDWDKLKEIETSEVGSYRTLTLRSCRCKEKSLALCQIEPEERWYSEIRVQLGSNRFTLKKCNIPERGDICLFEICVPPIRDHECLGNICNLTCEEEKAWVNHLMDILEKYGIFAVRDYAVLKKAEININLFLVANHTDFIDAVEILRPCRQGLDNRFTYSDYFEKDKEDYYCFVINKFHQEETSTKKMNQTSFNMLGKSLDIKIYDKSAETIKKSNGDIAWMSPITRVEFSINEPNEIPVYFGFYNLFELRQEDVESAFHYFAIRFFRNPLRQYYRDMNVFFEKVFENIDFKKHAWRKELILILDGAVKRTGDFYIMTFADLKRLVGLIPASSMIKNRSRVAKSLRDGIRTYAVNIRIVDEWGVDDLLELLCELTGEEEQSIVYYLNEEKGQG